MEFLHTLDTVSHCCLMIKNSSVNTFQIFLIFQHLIVLWLLQQLSPPSLHPVLLKKSLLFIGIMDLFFYAWLERQKSKLYFWSVEFCSPLFCSKAIGNQRIYFPFTWFTVPLCNSLPLNTRFIAPYKVFFEYLIGTLPLITVLGNQLEAGL